MELAPDTEISCSMELAPDTENILQYGVSSRHGNLLQYGVSSRHWNILQSEVRSRLWNILQYGVSSRHWNLFQYGVSSRHWNILQYRVVPRHWNLLQYGVSSKHWNLSSELQTLKSLAVWSYFQTLKPLHWALGTMTLVGVGVSSRCFLSAWVATVFWRGISAKKAAPTVTLHAPSAQHRVPHCSPSPFDLLGRACGRSEPAWTASDSHAHRQWTRTQDIKGHPGEKKQGPRSSRMRSGFAYMWRERYVERFTVTPCSEK